MSMRDRIAKAILGGKVGGPTPTGIHVYHSSPHDIDKFDWSKMGTGEGAQVRGKGFYFAEHPQVSGQGGDYWNSFQERFSGAEGRASEFLRQAAFDRQKALELARFNMENTARAPAYTSEAGKAKVLEEYQQAMELLRGSNQPIGPRTYEVNIKARPEQLLNLDTYASGQSPYVLERLKSLGVHPQEVSLENTQRQAFGLLDDLRKVKGAAPWVGEDIDEIGKRVKNFTKPHQIWAEMRGIPSYYGIHNPIGRAAIALKRNAEPTRTIWDEIEPTVHAKLANIRASLAEQPMQRHLEDALQGPERAAAALRSVEIPGSRYFDAGSRTSAMDAAPTFNYVVNDPSKLDIMAKYGVVGATGGVLGAGAMGGTIDQSSYGVRQ